MKGHVELTNAEALKFKEGDGPAFAVPRPDHRQAAARRRQTAASTRSPPTSCPAGAASASRCELMVDIEGEGRSSPCSAPARRTKLLLASSDGRGFVTPAADAIAETRKGKQVVNLRPGAKLKRGAADRARATIIVAVIGENRKLVVFPLDRAARNGPRAGRPAAALPRRRAGRRDRPSRFAEGLSWAMGGESGRTRTETDLTPGAPRAAPPAGCRRPASRRTSRSAEPAAAGAATDTE